MPNDILDRLHPSLRETFIPITADITLLLPGDVVAVAHDILASLTSNSIPVPEPTGNSA